MANYTNRTCHVCGIRKPQPQMFNKEIYTEVAKSKTGVSGATFVGSMLGDKKSSKSINSWLFNSGQRTYKRKKKVWLCGNCKNKVSSGEELSAGNVILFILIVAAVIFFMGSA